MDLTGTNFRVPEQRYLNEPTNESCYQYLKDAYAKISADYGEYDAFITPVLQFESATSMTRLFNDVEKMAAFLDSKGIKKGDVVTAFLPSCGHAFIAFYALSKLGVISNFVHPMTPPNQLLEIMAHTKSKGLFILDLFALPFKSVIEQHMAIVCSTSDFCDGIAFKYAKGNEMQNAPVPEHENVVRYMDIMAMDLSPVPDAPAPGMDDAIYLHGGGTTGKSKTIIHSNFSFNSLAYKLYILDTYHEYCKCYSMCTLPCFHAFGLGGAMHYAICNAYQPIMIPKLDPVQANELIRKYRVTEILSVPRMFQKLVEAPNFENEGTKNLAMIFAGGDVVTNEFVRKFDDIMEKHGAPARLCRGYGLTEMCAVCTTNSHFQYNRESAGYPLPGVEIEIWDDDCNKLPAGTIGEIVFAGDTMMNRYLPDDVIQETGIYIDENGKKWVRTGDMGYLDEDGYVFFSGRKKRIIIIAGYNIYPATIEQKLEKLDYLNEVCAVQGYNEEGKPDVKLCVSLRDPEADKAEIEKELLRYCRQNMEAYACPRRVEFHELLPRTKMEKIDFVKLSDPVPAC
ncbi:MAG: acyl--CoA ligase [Clostridia bacterium]|nr:acyl--CoA ligase [Clostridia bacterium]